MCSKPAITPCRNLAEGRCSGPCQAAALAASFTSPPVPQFGEAGGGGKGPSTTIAPEVLAVVRSPVSARDATQFVLQTEPNSLSGGRCIGGGDPKTSVTPTSLHPSIDHKKECP